ncbi:MAG: hypothetical protein CVV05_00800 [Gammaproteobacteria bacterium HGW-Gammaproteobacteria-1]|jgi:GNAT superfamily N-acetyltransferase|nr:MAG: hypothetical protein CVV05_00800 [Gammaproteobacteria bacterium HGW-Gammaproteobacteria-1]
MTLPTFDKDFRDGQRIKPRILMLEVRNQSESEGKPIAWLLVEREETYRRDDRDESISGATIRFHWEVIGLKHSRRTAGNGSFRGSYSRGFSGGPAVSVAPAAVFLDPAELRGQRIGTYLMNEVVVWAKQWPGATVQPIQLLSRQAHEDNKERRNRFYEQFGLVFDYRDPEHREGRSRPILAEALTPVETWKANLREWDARDCLVDILNENEWLQYELVQRRRAVESLSAKLRGIEENPVRWALRRVWWRVAPSLFLVAVLLAIGAAGWSAVTGG